MSYEIYDPNQQPGYGPPPARRSYTGWIVAGIIVTTLVVMVVSCALGGAVIIGLAPTPSATPTSTPTPGSSISSTSTPAPRASIHPAGSPYAWQLPSGFVTANAPADLRGGADYASAAVLEPSDTANILVVGSGSLDVDTGTLSAAALRQAMDEVVTGLGHDPKTGRALTVNGYSALRYEFTYATARAYSYFAFKGATAVQVICRWSDEQQEITRGCDQLLGTLTID